MGLSHRFGNDNERISEESCNYSALAAPLNVQVGIILGYS
jgi:hypothetical protein